MAFNFTKALEVNKVSIVFAFICLSIFWTSFIASNSSLYCLIVPSLTGLPDNPTPVFTAWSSLPLLVSNTCLKTSRALTLLSLGNDAILSAITRTTASLLRIEFDSILTIDIGTNPLYSGLAAHQFL